jgi:hypothetical protein
MLIFFGTKERDLGLNQVGMRWVADEKLSHSIEKVFASKMELRSNLFESNTTIDSL